jgi:hypothetical protein
MYEELAKPNTASTSPEASIGSRTGKADILQPHLAVVELVDVLKIGHCAKAASAAGAPNFLPSRLPHPR